MAGAMEPRGAVLGSSLAHRGQLQPHGTRTEPFPSGLGPKEILPLAFEDAPSQGMHGPETLAARWASISRRVSM